MEQHAILSFLIKKVNEKIKVDNRLITEESSYYQDEEIKVDYRFITEESSYHQDEETKVDNRFSTEEISYCHDDFYEEKKLKDSIVGRSNQFYIFFFKL